VLACWLGSRPAGRPSPLLEGPAACRAAAHRDAFAGGQPVTICAPRTLVAGTGCGAGSGSRDDVYCWFAASLGVLRAAPAPFRGQAEAPAIAAASTQTQVLAGALLTDAGSRGGAGQAVASGLWVVARSALAAGAQLGAGCALGGVQAGPIWIAAGLAAVHVFVLPGALQRHQWQHTLSTDGRSSTRPEESADALGQQVSSSMCACPGHCACAHMHACWLSHRCRAGSWHRGSCLQKAQTLWQGRLGTQP
jgi:hypothetical protein